MILYLILDQKGEKMALWKKIGKIWKDSIDSWLMMLFQH